MNSQLLWHCVNTCMWKYTQLMLLLQFTKFKLRVNLKVMVAQKGHSFVKIATLFFQAWVFAFRKLDFCKLDFFWKPWFLLTWLLETLISSILQPLFLQLDVLWSWSFANLMFSEDDILQLDHFNGKVDCFANWLGY